MPEQGTSSIARLVAVGGLILIFIAVIAVIATSGGDGGSDDGPIVKDSGPDIEATKQPSQDRDVQTALDRGEYVVQPGDSLTTIAEDTGIDIETLEQLNPGIDPQALQEGARVRLR